MTTAHAACRGGFVGFEAGWWDRAWVPLGRVVLGPPIGRAVRLSAPCGAASASLLRSSRVSPVSAIVCVTHRGPLFSRMCATGHWPGAARGW